MTEEELMSGDVDIDVSHSAINFKDGLAITGARPVIRRYPMIPGVDLAGRVTRSRHDSFVPGDIVVATGCGLGEAHFGGFAQKARLNSDWLVKLPKSLTPALAMTIGTAGLTAALCVLALERYGLSPENGPAVVTGASGGVGLAGVEVVRALGARPIAGVTSKPKGELAVRHGAEAWVDLKAPNLLDSLRDQVQKVAGPQGVHCVLDVVGGDVFDAALRALAPAGRIVVIGFAGGRIAEAKTNYLLLKNLSVVGFHVEPYIREQPELVEDAMADLFALYERGKLKPEVSAVYPLEQFQTALAGFGKGGIEGKVVLTTARS